MADETQRVDLEVLLSKQKELASQLRSVGADLKKLKGEAERTGGAFSKFGRDIKTGVVDAFKQFGPMAVAAGGATLAIGALSTAFQGMLDKETSLADFSAITGVTGAELENFGDIATDLSNKFGTSTVENIESFKGILSRLGPDIAQSTEAVQIMGDNVNTLSVAAGLSATESMDALTTSMLQFGVDLTDPVAAANEMTNMMNVMAAGAKLGAAEVPSISEALKQAGATAKASGLSFEETNAALQVLATAGKTGSEAGVGLRNVLVLMQKASGPAAQELSRMGLSTEQLGETLQGPNGLTNATALLRDGLTKLESPAQRNAALAKIFGAENLVAAQSLIAGTDAIGEFTTGVTGTNTALEQMETKMGTTQAGWNKFTTFLENTAVDSLEKVKDSIGGIIQQAGGLVDFLKGDLSFADANKAAHEMQLNMTFGAGAVADMKKQLQGAKPPAEQMTATMHNMTREVDKFTGLDLAGNFNMIGEEAKKASFNVTTLFGAMTQENNQRTPAVVRQELEELTKSFEDVGEVSAEDKKKFFALQKELEDMTGWMKKSKKQGIDPVIGSLGHMEKELGKITSDMDNKLIPGSNAFLEAAVKADKLRLEIERTKSAMEELVDRTLHPEMWARIDEGMQRPVESMIALHDVSTETSQSVIDELGRLQNFDAGQMPALKSLQDEFKFTEELGVTAFNLLGDAFGNMGQIFTSTSENAGEQTKAILKGIANSVITIAQAELFAAEAVAFVKAIFSSGATLTTDIAWSALGFFALEAAKGALASLDVGTAAVPRDMPAMIHQGEMIVPDTFASALRSGDITIGGRKGNSDVFKRKKGRTLVIEQRDPVGRITRMRGMEKASRGVA